MKFRVEDNSNNESYFDPIEKLYNIPLYIVRKLIFFICKSFLVTVAQLSKLFGFHFDYEFEDKARWKWFNGFKLPRPYAGLDRD